MLIRILVTALGVVLLAPGPGLAQELYDIVILGGRVMDPETGRDEIANVGIRGDRIEAITSGDIRGRQALYGRVVAGSDGTLWVSPVDYLADPTVLLAFDPQGRFAGTVEIPGTFVVYDSGPGWMVGLLRGENDVEYIQMYELRR